MSILIGALYSNREVFLRELISNAADALDKVRFLALTTPSLLTDGAELEIKVSYDEQRKTLTITDTGIGMTKADLINNLGTVAKSGTTEFLEASAAAGGDLNLIGQFGVGFYAVYLVADKVTVISKNPADEQHIWESDSQVFHVSKDPRGNTLGRGTSIVLHLKDDALEFLNEAALSKLIGRYSQFINFPIKLRTTKTVEKPVEPASDNKEEMEVSEDEDAEKEKPETVTETVTEWVKVNEAKSIWMRNPKDITEEEYVDFYQTLTKDTGGVLDKIHFVAEGEITFRAILYIPKKVDSAIYDRFYDKSTGLKLYVRRVLISDEFEDFLPRYMNFVKGIIDSDDLPLSVSRETLAQSRILKVMAKKLTRKVLELLRKMADREGKNKNSDYQNFWQQYSKSVKMGVIDDKKNKSKLIKLLRYKSSKSNGAWTSFEEYVDRMKESQDKIYYLTCESLAACEANPVAEKFKARDIELLYMDEPVDEYVAPQITEFDGLDPVNALRESATLPETKAFTQLSKSEDFTELLAFFKEVLGNKASRVIVSNKLTSSPAACSAPEYGWTGNMERIMRAQALQQQRDVDSQLSQKVFEINPYHPIIQEINSRRKANAKDETLVDLVNILFESASVVSGYSMAEPETFAKRIYKVISIGLEVDPEAKVE